MLINKSKKMWFDELSSEIKRFNQNKINTINKAQSKD
jgi:hypothetical protein